MCLHEYVDDKMRARLTKNKLCVSTRKRCYDFLIKKHFHKNPPPLNVASCYF